MCRAALRATDVLALEIDPGKTLLVALFTLISLVTYVRYVRRGRRAWRIAALIGYATLIAGGFSRLGFWREVLLAVVLMALIQTLTNSLAGAAMRQAKLVN